MALQKLTSLLLLASFLVSLFHPLAHAQFDLLDHSVVALPQFTNQQPTVASLPTIGDDGSELQTGDVNRDGSYVHVHCETCDKTSHFLLPVDNTFDNLTVFMLKQARRGQTFRNAGLTALERPPRVFPRETV